MLYIYKLGFNTNNRIKTYTIPRNRKLFFKFIEYYLIEYWLL
jgi:hypothetical protein